MKFGSQEQKDYWLPRMLTGEDWWCQGYSEPGSGSDLASLKTSAVRDGDFYIVNGQKTWTTFAQHANMIFCLVRTSNEGKPQEGISFILIDMNSPGIEVRPIITLDGSHEVNEIFFSDVKVPAKNLVGVENKGWTYAKYLLTHERTGNANVAVSKRKIQKLKKLADDAKKNEQPLSNDPMFASRLAQIEIDLQNLEITNLRTLAAVEDGEAPGAESSIIKILGSEIEQDIDNLTRKSLGKRAFVNEPDALSSGYNGAEVFPKAAAYASGKYFNHRKKSIYAGSNEIQKNIISKLMLNL
jgi:alkylation response protein AidB-like acyl-CoA dehydrogenase